MALVLFWVLSSHTWLVAKHPGQCRSVLSTNVLLFTYAAKAWLFCKRSLEDTGSKKNPFIFLFPYNYTLVSHNLFFIL